jgi:hypothetical protein
MRFDAEWRDPQDLLIGLAINLADGQTVNVGIQVMFAGPAAGDPSQILAVEVQRRGFEAVPDPAFDGKGN